MPVAQKAMSLTRFLKLPETKPAREFIDGKVVRKKSPKFRHGWLEGLLSESLNTHARARRLGKALPELRCTFAGRSYVYDVSFFREDRIAYGPDGELIDDVFLPPDLAVEILSAGRSPRTVEAKLSWSIRHGVRLAWFVDPYGLGVKVFEPGGRPRTLKEGDTLDGKDAIPGFRLAVKTLFGWLRREKNL